jgi:UDP-glucose 4-epimerase
MHKMKKLIIFGGTGYLGTNLATKLSQKFIVSVTGRRDLSPVFMQLFKTHNISYYKAEIKNLPMIYSLIDQNDYVIYAVPNTQPHQVKPVFHSDLLKIIKPSEKIFEYGSKMHKRIIFLSSGGSVYGVGNSDSHSEDSKPEPIDQYGKYKLRLDKSLLSFNSKYHSNNVVLRISNPYGGTFDNHFKQGFINSVIRNVETKNEIEIWGDGKQIRDFIYIEDIVNLALLILGKESAAGIFNCGTGMGHSLREVIEITERLLNAKIQVRFVDEYKENIQCNILNIHKSVNYFDWHPGYDVQKTLSKLLKAKQ